MRVLIIGSIISLLLICNIFAKIQVSGEVWATYTNSSDYLKSFGKDKFEIDYAAISLQGEIYRRIIGTLKYNVVEPELENAYLTFAGLKNSDVTVKVGKQYNIFGLKNTEATDISITPTVEQNSTHKLSGANNNILIVEYPMLDIGSFLFSFQDDNSDSSEFFRNFTLKLKADKIMEGINLSLSYQMLCMDRVEKYKPQYSAGIIFDFGSMELSAEYINIVKDLVSDTHDCKILSLEMVYKYHKKSKLLIDYLRVDKQNYYSNPSNVTYTALTLSNGYSLPSLKTQLRVGFEFLLYDNLILLTEWGQDEGNNIDIDWYKAQLRAFF